MEANQLAKKKSRRTRALLWLGLAALVLAALWCCNLVIFHLWASDVPPYETEWHLRWAKFSAVALLGFLVAIAFCIRYLVLGRAKEVRTAA
jgi:uncharacterized membrane protein YqjE